MPRHDPRIDAYIADAAEFARPILERLREIVHSVGSGVDETMKWSAPSFVYRGKILCGMAAFKRHASFGFWQHAQVMGEQAKRDGMGSFGKLASLADLPPEQELVSLLRRAMALIDDGVPTPQTRKTAAPRPAPDVPADLAAALAANPAAQKVFSTLPPSHRREYIEWVVEAKRDKTRVRRIEQAVAWIAEGKQRNWKYAKGC